MTTLLAALPILMLLGLAAAQWRTVQVEAPVLERRGAYQIEGEVLLVEARVRGDRLVLGGLTIDGVSSDMRRPSGSGSAGVQAEPPLAPGDRIAVRAMLMPPSPPSEPYGFDFSRKAFFEQLGAVGYSLGPPATLERGGWLVHRPGARHLAPAARRAYRWHHPGRRRCRRHGAADRPARRHS